jgi:hypothetical protein
MRPCSVQPYVVLLCVGQAALGCVMNSSQHDSQRVDLRVELEQLGVSGRVSHGGAWWPSHSQGSVSSTAGAGSLSIDAAALPSHPRHELQLIRSKPQHPLFCPFPCTPPPMRPFPCRTPMACILLAPFPHRSSARPPLTAERCVARTIGASASTCNNGWTKTCMAASMREG